MSPSLENIFRRARSTNATSCRFTCTFLMYVHSSNIRRVRRLLSLSTSSCFISSSLSDRAHQMGFWNPFTRAAVQRFASDPNFRRFVGNIKQKIASHPQAKKLVEDIKLKARTAFSNAKSSAPGTNATASGASGTTSKSGADFFQRTQQYWEKNKDRFIGFLVANFMGVLFFIQFGSQAWHLLVQMWKQYFHENSIDAPKKKKKRDSSQAQNQVRAIANPTLSQSAPLPQDDMGLVRDPYALRLDVDNPQQHMLSMADSNFAQTNEQSFETSFQFKIGDSMEFQSSLDSALVTGAIETSSSWFGSSEQPVEMQTFDLRKAKN